MNKIRLVVVDDHALFRAGLISLLSEMSEFQIVGEAGEGSVALEVVNKVKPAGISPVTFIDVGGHHIQCPIFSIDSIVSVHNSSTTKKLTLPSNSTMALLVYCGT